MAVLLAATSCNRSNNEVVLIDPDDAVEAVLEDVACDIRIIPLKSDKPIPNAILFYFYDDYFFSIAPDIDYAFKDISVFDNDGNLLGTIDRYGRGHNEYISLLNFLYQPDRKQLLLYSRDPEKYYQDFQIFTFQLPGLELLGTGHNWFMASIPNLVQLGDGRCLNANWKYGTDLQLVSILPDTAIIIKKYENMGGNRIGPTFTNQFTNPQNPLVATFGYENNIYSLTDEDSLKLEFSFTFGDKGLPRSYTNRGPYSILILDEEWEQYMKEGLAITYGVPVKNGDLLSFCYKRYHDDYAKSYTHYYLTNGRKSANYSKLTIPGLKYTTTLAGINGTSYVYQLQSVEKDSSVPMSELGQQILDAVQAQNDDNPILLQFRFKDLE